MHDLRSYIFSERKKIVFSMLGKDFKKILDIGCGPGVYADELSKRCEEFYGVDISPEMINMAKSKKYGNAKFSIGEIENLQFKDELFDGVICVGVLEYLDNIEDAVKEIARVTKKNGIAIFTVPNASSALNKLDYYMRVILKAARKVIKIDISKSFMNYDFKPKLIYRRKLGALLREYGFEIKESRFHIFRISFLNRLNPRLSLFLARKCNFISSEFLATNYIVKARKK